MFEKEKGLSTRMMEDAHNGMQSVTNEINCITNIWHDHAVGEVGKKYGLN